MLQHYIEYSRDDVTFKMYFHHHENSQDVLAVYQIAIFILPHVSYYYFPLEEHFIKVIRYLMPNIYTRVRSLYFKVLFRINEQRKLLICNKIGSRIYIVKCLYDC